MDNQDKSTFSLDDEEIVEEEVIDRDEEYEDDEGYDDEEYGDEEGYDEGEEDYGEEGYDDGYNDDYYDDRLNKVLDALAELKRGGVPANSVQPPMPMPQYIYNPSAPPAGSEVVMYNEISRLRDELAKNQSSLEMQKELTRIKEDMQRDQKFAEAQYNAEIQRLQSKIDDLLKNVSGPQSELPLTDSVPFEGGNSTLDSNKLISITEAILHATKDSGARLQSEIVQLKKQLDDIPSLKELNSAVAAVKKAASGISGSDGSINNGAVASIASEIAALKSAIGAGAFASGAASAVNAAENNDIAADELLRQLYDIKTVLGNSSEAAVKRAQALSELADDFKQVKYDVLSHTASYKDKLDAVYGFAKKLAAANESDAIDLFEVTNGLIAELNRQPLTRNVFGDLVAYCNENGITAMTSAMRDAAEKYFGLSQKISETGVESYGDYLPDLVSAINTFEGNTKNGKNAELVAEITNALTDEQGDKASIKANLAELTALTVADIDVLPQVEMPVSYKSAERGESVNVFAKLAEIKTALADLMAVARQTQAAAVQAATARATANSDDSQGEGESYSQPVVDFEPVATLDDTSVKQILDSIDELKAGLESTTSVSGVADAIEEIRNDYLDIVNKLVDISERLQQPMSVETTMETGAMSDEDRQAVAQSFEYIRNKLDDYDVFFNSIAELRADIEKMSGGVSEQVITDQINGVINEIATQLDKLYEDFSNALIETESSILGHLGDGGVADAVDLAKNEILAETQAIKDSLASVADAVAASPVTDAVEQLRADLDAYIEQSNGMTDLAAVDRQKLLDDVAFLREQAELAIADGEQAGDNGADQESEKLFGYLDEISGRVAVITSVADTVNATNAGVTALNDNINTVMDSVAALSDNVTSVSDTLAAINDGVVSVSDGIMSVSDRVASVSDAVSAMSGDVATVRDTASDVLAAIEPISNRLNDIVDMLSVSESSEEVESVTTTLTDEDYAELKANIGAILDSMANLPQAEDVIAARDNTYNLLDSVSSLAQAEDVGVIRDNVAALLDAVNALGETVNGYVAADSDKQSGSEELAALRETADLTAEDVRFIRQTLEEKAEQPDEIATVVQDLAAVLDRIEQFELAAATNKQEIIDAVGGIREEIHINTLDENMSAAGLDDETRDALVGEISEIRERLVNLESMAQSNVEVNSDALNGITEQINELRAVLDEKFATAESDVAEDQSSAESMQAIIDELGAIKEKLDVAVEPVSAADLFAMREDIFANIDALREDIKAVQIVDQGDVASELESIKNELAAISSGNILDEIRALREDVSNLSGGEGGVAPTGGEINLVLNEIVSLRDEVFSFKDEVLNATAGGSVEQQPTDVEAVKSDDDLSTIIDEITALRSDQVALTGSIDELKDIVSRRTSLGTVEGEEGGQPVGDLNVVLDEIINLKNDIDRVNETIGGDRLNVIAEQVEDIRAVIDELRGGVGLSADQSGTVSATVDLAPIMEQFQAVNAALDDIRLNRSASVDEEGGEVSATITERFDELYSEIVDIRTVVENMAPIDYAAEIAEMRAQIEALRAENEQLKSTGSDGLSAQIADLKDMIRGIAVSGSSTEAVGGESYSELIDEIRELKEQLALSSVVEQSEEQSMLIGELGDIRDEIAQLRSLTSVAAEGGSLSEVAAMRDELAQLRAMIASPDSMLGVAEDVTMIRADVQKLKEEPDLGVMSEILALRDEFQALREQIEDVKRVAEQTNHSADESLLTEVQSLRDQLFAISMANVNDPSSGETNYESYNNIILDEISSLRDQINTSGASSNQDAIYEELEQLKAAIAKRDELYENLSKRMVKSDGDATDAKILQELASIRADMANQRDADMSTLNFMSEMAHLVERQNQYLTQNAGTRLTDEIESLKAEIASSDAVAEEVAKLREVLMQSGRASDNETILNELADLREELSREKPSSQNMLILDAISRLRDEMTVLAEREKVRDINSDADLSDSLTDLKAQLNEIAGIVEPVERQAGTRKSAVATRGTRSQKSAQKSAQKTAQKSGQKVSSKSNAQKSQSGSKRGRPPKNQKGTSASTSSVITERTVRREEKTRSDLEALIAEQASLLGGGGDMSLDPQAVTTRDAMDVADKLAKQVANKLIMEQLVAQLGDGGVSEERVDEILREILPQEFTTIAETEASDKVRRLANKLVLDKLRARLNGSRGVDNDD